MMFTNPHIPYTERKQGAQYSLAGDTYNSIKITFAIQRFKYYQQNVTKQKVCMLLQF